MTRRPPTIPGLAPGATTRRRPPALALALPLILLLGTLLRLAPCLREPGFEFVVDASYHERLTHQVLDTGHVAPLDPMSGAPEGRRTAEHLPLGLYHAGAATRRVLSALGWRDPRTGLALFVALAGALIALPVWLGVRALGGGPAAALFAALLATLLPAHLQRSFGFTLRADGLGTLLATLHAALAFGALGATEARRRWAWAAAAALALAATLASWRAGLVVLELEALAAAAWLAWRGVTPGHRALWSALATLGTLALLPVGYLGAHGFLRSGAWLVVVALAIACWLPPLAPTRSWRPRLAVLAALGLAVAFAARPDRSGDYANLGAMLAARFGLAHGHDPLAALMLDVQELRGLAPWSLLFDPERLGVMGGWLLATPFLLMGLGARGERWSPAATQHAVVTGGLVVATLAFERTGVLLAPFTAIALGLLADALLAPAPARTPARKGAARGGERLPRRALRVALALSAALTAALAVQQCATAWARLDHDETDALAWLRAHATPGDVVVCDWDSGYDVQSRAGLPTVVDGLLESAANRRRIIELYGAFLSPSPEPLARLCGRTHARWLLAPPGTAIPAMAHVIGDPLWDAIQHGERFGPGPMMEHTIVHLVGNDRDLPGFRRAFTAGPFQVYEVSPPAAGSPSVPAR